MFDKASELLNDELEELLALLGEEVKGLIGETVRRIERAMVTASAAAEEMQTLRCIHEQHVQEWGRCSAAGTYNDSADA